MSKIWHICAREWAMSWHQRRLAYLLLPWAAAVLQALGAQRPAAGFGASLGLTAWATVLVAPWLVGDPFGRERRGGRFALMWSLPVRDGQIAAGKFFAGQALVALALAPCLWTLGPAGALGGAQWAGSLLALLLVAAALCALALASAALVAQRWLGQAAASLLGLGLWSLGWPARWVPPGLAPWLDYLSLPHHMQALSQGRLDSRDLVYFLTIIAGAVAVGTSSLCREAGEV